MQGIQLYITVTLIEHFVFDDIISLAIMYKFYFKLNLSIFVILVK